MICRSYGFLTDFMDFSRRLYRWASEGVDMYVIINVEMVRSSLYPTGTGSELQIGMAMGPNSPPLHQANTKHHCECDTDVPPPPPRHPPPHIMVFGLSVTPPPPPSGCHRKNISPTPPLAGRGRVEEADTPPPHSRVNPALGLQVLPNV